MLESGVFGSSFSVLMPRKWLFRLMSVKERASYWNYLDGCLKLLIEADRIPEAALFARTYLPSKVPEVVEKWRAWMLRSGSLAGQSNAQKMASMSPEQLLKEPQLLSNSDTAAQQAAVNSGLEKSAEALANPIEYENLFPGWRDSVKVEQYQRLERQFLANKAMPSASEYPILYEQREARDYLAIANQFETQKNRNLFQECMMRGSGSAPRSVGGSSSTDGRSGGVPPGGHISSSTSSQRGASPGFPIRPPVAPTIAQPAVAKTASSVSSSSSKDKAFRGGTPENVPAPNISEPPPFIERHMPPPPPPDKLTPANASNSSLEQQHKETEKSQSKESIEKPQPDDDDDEGDEFNWDESEEEQVGGGEEQPHAAPVAPPAQEDAEPELDDDFNWDDDDEDEEEEEDEENTRAYSKMVAGKKD